MKHVKDNKLLYEYQSGFRQSYSTDTCLINLMDYIRTLKSKGKYVGMVLLDLQKAFDTVNHEILCNKLEAMGINFTKWFKSYLGGRQQIVIANETRSDPGTVTCGAGCKTAKIKNVAAFTFQISQHLAGSRGSARCGGTRGIKLPC